MHGDFLNCWSLNCLFHQLQARAFAAWKEETGYSKRKAEVVTWAVGCIRGGSLRRSFSTWKSAAALAADLRKRGSKCASRIARGTTARAFCGWRAAVARRADLRCRGMACCIRMSDALRARAFNSWIHVAVLQQQQRFVHLFHGPCQKLDFLKGKHTWGTRGANPSSRIGKKGFAFTVS
jgi:hypothetical protein